MKKFWELQGKKNSFIATNKHMILVIHVTFTIVLIHVYNKKCIKELALE